MERLQSEQQFIQRLVTLIIKKQTMIIENWLKATYFTEDDPFYEEIVQNAKKTITLILLYLEEQNETYMIDLTKKVAKERIEAGVNISEFVSNINIGRTIINELISVSDLNDKEKLSSMMIIDDVFHIYLYHSVKEYTKLKDEIITKKNLFIQEMHSDRLTVLGQIAASFAHEFRNPLTSIKGFMKILSRKFKGDKEARTYFSIIDQEMESLEEKVSQFLFLSKVRGLDDTTDKVDLNNLVQKMVNFLYPRFVDENIEVKVNLDEDCFIEAVEEQVKQVLLNILTNAVEELASITKKRYIKIDSWKENNQVILELSNNGPQIPGHLQEDIFEPFVTTKDLGTGLGLSVCKQIVEKHSGRLEVTSDEDWTTFKIFFQNIEEPA
ncbi:histidine kinase N-terminal domain-containing protein [Bacillus tianshenii]|nr:histidine kinase N-terminal domain-containing protein [Bacillus tianshenii]